MITTLNESKALTDLLFTGTGPDDTMLTNTIDTLKQAAYDCMETRVTGFNLTDEQRATLDSINVVLVETRQQLCAISADFADTVKARFKE